MSLRMFMLAAAAGLVVAASASAAPLHKCTVNGTVTYQQGPCASDQPRKTPTVQELNAESRKKREAAASAPAERAAPIEKAAPAAPAAAAGFSCDGRKTCGQMRSCAEARYFLANCPGVTMDGDGNGVPCERQWCSR